MRILVEQGDDQFLEQIHRLGSCTIQDLCEAACVTATAVRQRLNRLQSMGFVSRETVRHGRGRPHHTYLITARGLQQLGDNYGELALLLWGELNRIENPEIREAIRGRLRDSMARHYGVNVSGQTLDQRMEQLRDVLIQRGFRMEIGERDGTPILRERNCPYHELASGDRSICDLEQDVFQQVLGVPLQLSQCCLDGHGCCEFHPVRKIEAVEEVV